MKGTPVLAGGFHVGVGGFCVVKLGEIPGNPVTGPITTKPGTPVPEQNTGFTIPPDQPGRRVLREQGHLVDRDCIQFYQPVRLGNVFDYEMCSRDSQDSRGRQAQYFFNYPTPYGIKTALSSDIHSRTSIRDRNGLISPSGFGGEHKKGTILSTTEIILVIRGENPKPVKLRCISFSL
ncbi:hypothetical protein [Methanoregula sp.]|uniref:hypothetical protein n=1 Tax=Methanoregula sp. TaxID=2052170 RepID=UPI00356654A0